jgi:hypothetical protein
MYFKVKDNIRRFTITAQLLRLLPNTLPRSVLRVNRDTFTILVEVSEHEFLYIAESIEVCSWSFRSTNGSVKNML